MQSFSEDQIDNIHKILYSLRKEMVQKRIFYFRQPAGFTFKRDNTPEYYLAANKERNSKENQAYIAGFLELHNNFGSINISPGTLIVKANDKRLLDRAPSLRNCKNAYAYIFTPIHVKHKIVAFLTSVIEKDELEFITEDMLTSLGAFFDMISSIFSMQELSINIENKLEYKNKFEQLVTKMSTEHASCPNDRIDNVINDSLMDLCEFTESDYGFIYLNDENNKTITRTNYWANGYTINESITQDIYKEPWKHIMEHLAGDGIMVCHDCDKFHGLDVCEEYGRQVKSIIIIPILCNSDPAKNLKGFFGIASKLENKYFDNKDFINKLKVIGTLVTSAIKRRYWNQAKDFALLNLSSQLEGWKTQTTKRQDNLEKLRMQLLANTSILSSNNSKRSLSAGTMGS